MGIQEHLVHEYLLPVPVEGTRPGINVTIEGAQQRPVSHNLLAADYGNGSSK